MAWISSPLPWKEQPGVKSVFPSWAMIWPAFSPPTVRSIISGLVKNSRKTPVAEKHKRIIGLWPSQCEEIILQLGNAWEFQLLTKWNCKTNRPQQDHEQSGLGFPASDEISKTLNWRCFGVWGMSQSEYLPVASKPILEICVHWCIDSLKKVICTFAGSLPGSILSCPLTTSAQVDHDHQRSVDIPLNFLKKSFGHSGFQETRSA